MAWRIEYDESAKKDLAKLDKPTARRILSFLRERVLKQESPRDIGEALKGLKFGELWKYRVGDYRIVAQIRDQEFIVLVVRIGHRRNVYR